MRKMSLLMLRRITTNPEAVVFRAFPDGDVIAMDEYTHREHKPGPMSNPIGERYEREQIWKMVRAAIAKATGGAE